MRMPYELLALAVRATSFVRRQVAAGVLPIEPPDDVALWFFEPESVFAEVGERGRPSDVGGFRYVIDRLPGARAEAARLMKTLKPTQYPALLGVRGHQAMVGLYVPSAEQIERVRGVTRLRAAALVKAGRAAA